MLESTVLNAHDVAGIVLRYGSYYGSGTSLSPGGEILEMVCRRQLPLVGNGAGDWSFIHIDDAAYATQLAIEHGTPGLYNIVDDEPAEVAARAGPGDWRQATVPHIRLARTIGVWGCWASMMTAVRGSSNTKAKRALGWHPEHAS